MATSKRKAWVELNALDARVEETRQREAEARAAQSAANREVDAAQSRLAAYFEEIESGSRQASPKQEEELIAEHRDAKAAASDAVHLARTEAAVNVREQAEAELEEWGYKNVPRLLAELGPRAQKAKERIEAAHAEQEEASGEYADVQRAAVRVARFADLPPEDVPPHPDRGTTDEVAAHYLRGVELPLPRTLLAREEEAA